MKKKVLIVIYIIMLIITVKLLYKISNNCILMSKYNNGKYDEGQAKGLTVLNFQEQYIPYYNYGNILYQNGKYEEAIEEYKKALSKSIPKYKECNIRINYALSICKMVKLDENDKKSIEEAIGKYESAIDILTEVGCANKNDNNGHDQKAEQLKKDIQKEIDRLKRLQQSTSNSDDEENKDENDNKEESNEDESIEEEIEQIKKDATMEQKNVESSYDYKKYNYVYSKNNNW